MSRMDVLEPVPMSLPRSVVDAQKGGIEGRWRVWYAAVADHMLAHPGCTNAQIAKALNKHPNTIGLITNTDMFRDYFARRRAAYTADHDFALRSKMTSVAEKSLDLLLEKLEKKADQIPVQQMTELATGVLDRLGYNPKAPAPSVNVNLDQSDNRHVTVSVASLAEATEALRLVEARRAAAALPAGEFLGDRETKQEAGNSVLGIPSQPEER